MYCQLEPCTNGRYFFEALQITVNVTGTYRIKAQSSFDSYGFFYNNSFDRTSPVTNLLGEDDESADSMQFLMSFTLDVLHRYVLVVTSYYEGETGKFIILSRGPGSTTFVRLNLSVSDQSK